VIIDHLEDQLLDVVGLVGVVRDQGVERVIEAVGRIIGRPRRRLFLVRQRQVVEKAAQHHQRLDIVVEGQVGNAGLAGVRDGTTEFLGRHLFVGHGLHHLGTGDEHVGGVLDHEDEVGHRRAVHRAAGAGAHDHRDLRNHAAGHDVALEHVGITAERRDAFLDARAAGIVEADYRAADLDRLVHDLADLLGVGLGQCAAEHGEVLREDEDHAAVDRAVADHHAVAGDLLLLAHAEIDAAVLLEHVPLFKGAVVEQ
jgi:hypothetical protein